MICKCLYPMQESSLLVGMSTMDDVQDSPPYESQYVTAPALRGSAVEPFSSRCSALWRSPARQPSDCVPRRILRPSGACHVHITSPTPLRGKPCYEEDSPQEQPSHANAMQLYSSWLHKSADASMYKPLTPLQPIMQQNIQVGVSNVPPVLVRDDVGQGALLKLSADRPNVLLGAWRYSAVL